MTLPVVVFFFFFKQKTAYEISACLVGSEMCIRDRYSKTSSSQVTAKANKASVCAAALKPI